MGVPEQSKISNATRSEPPRLRRWGYQGSRACLHLRYQNSPTGDRGHGPQFKCNQSPVGEFRGLCPRSPVRGVHRWEYRGSLSSLD